MRRLARLASSDRQDLFANTAGKLGLTTAIVEKDFWVCWTLDYLFHRCEWRKSITFKGGTSLSKAYKLIERFSEDLDLILDWRVLGYGKDTPLDERSKKQQDKLNKEIRAKTVDFLDNMFVPSLRAGISTELGIEATVEVDAGDKQTVLFRYPHEHSEQAILQDIRLEIGSLAAWTPSTQMKITPYAAEQYPGLFEEQSTSVLTVTPKRTFWEKATILHHEAHRPEYSKMPLRYSRHYYDMLILSQSWVKSEAFSDLNLLNQVVSFKQKFYPRTWAQYNEALPGTMKLMPPGHCINILKSDYAQMQSMIFGSKPDFSELLEGIGTLEHEINSL